MQSKNLLSARDRVADDGVLYESSTVKKRAQWHGSLGVVLASICVGALLVISRAGSPFERLGFDALFLTCPPAKIDDLIVVKLGDSAYRALGQTFPVFDRKLHAEFVRKLKADGARLVVFDVFFADPTPSDALLAAAIREHGNVVLGSDSAPVVHPLIKGTTQLDPAPAFIDLPGCRLGRVGLTRDSDLGVRKFLDDPADALSLHWVAAEAVGEVPAKAVAERERWIRYYGFGSSLPAIAFENALNAGPGYFRDKVVFIGGQPKTVYPSSEADEFFTALTRWTGETMAGVDIQATMFLNLVRREWLSKLRLEEELAIMGIAGLAFGALLSAMRPLPGLGLAAAGAALVWIAVIALSWSQRLWFNWAIIPLVQLPVAWLASAVFRMRRIERELGRAEVLETTERIRLDGAPAAVPQALEEMLPTLREPDRGTHVLIRDYELLRCVGRGAYGEVWLSRSVVGGYRAVKIVYRRNFGDERPFEREFEGVRNFEPISRSHPGWVSILHVARDDHGGHFYYVMEPADDLEGKPIDPATYRPKTLGALLTGRKRLPPAECIGIGIVLADALAALHDKGLVHRDVKPSNIVFMGGVAKLADIGLVSQAAKGGSFVGTEGYIPPEGPGTPLADIYSLGCVLFQAATGRNSPGRRAPEKEPEAEAETGEMKMLMEVIDRACESFYGKRFQTAAEMRDDLKRLARPN